MVSASPRSPDTSESTGFDGQTALPGSELWEVDHTLTNLNQQLQFARQGSLQLQREVSLGAEFVNSAANKADEIDRVYAMQSNTSDAWQEIQAWAGTAAAAQAAAEATYAVAGCISSFGIDPIKSGAAAGAATAWDRRCNQYRHSGGGSEQD
jgi:hypothetical protein